MADAPRLAPLILESREKDRQAAEHIERAPAQP